MDSSPMTLFGYFNERVKANLHLVVAMSPIGDTFRTRLRMFPSLINCCTIDWFTAWPDDALEMVATSLLQETKLEASLLAHCVTVCKYFHHSIDDLAHRYVTGLEKLKEAKLLITELQEELKLLQPCLVETSANTEALMIKIEQDTIQVERKQEV
ncbi:Dynein heavy chain 3, axonemal-like 15 [Homarus americanus]|uniref:Dynein heavy chain 3, axonemal-like 15 n=1 Tax=Homarus americanus TaxID=6706 RepID=A0A8J5MQ42_HOMAM|nr:Dynein heavy chain 3, axonemal-like 15 [Homarus americanus]